MISLGYRLSTAARVFVAVVGGYILTSSMVAAFALLLPFEPAEAALAATMFSFAIYAAIALGVFAIRSLWRAAGSIVAAIAVLRIALWACDRVVWG